LAVLHLLNAITLDEGNASFLECPNHE
jgi:hypothetical protein